MRYQDMHLRNILDIERWEKIQDQLAEVTKTAIITVDYRGFPITKHSCCSKFCAAMRENSATRSYCYKCDARGGLEAARTEKPYIYLCHCDVVDVAIPIIVNDRFLGSVMVGQVLLSREENRNELEKVFNTINQSESHDSLLKEEMLKTFNILPRMSYDQIQRIADMIFHIVNYIIEEAYNKAMTAQSYEMMMQKLGPYKARLGKDWSVSSNTFLEENDSDIITMIDPTLDEKIDVNISLRPAVTYVKQHIQENITMEQMAKLCHLSPSYFSRLFAREMGETFSNYVARCKIQYAKKMLETTNFTMAQIADSLNFADAGYFTKVFKKFEGLTPAEYKKHLITVKTHKNDKNF